ncbi:MAG: alpha/beta hydrolase [Chitinophagaceae bacterium]
MPNKPSIVLVHGAWADGSSWNKIIPQLEEAGYNVVATQHPLTTLADDAEITRRLCEAQTGAVLLVGHSYGGAVITEAAGKCPNVTALVYIAAFGPDAGESLTSLSAGGAPPPGAAAIRPDKYGRLWLDKALFNENFCGDVEDEEANTLAATQKPISVQCFQDTITNAGWKNLPNWYMIAANDRMIPPAAEQFMAERMKAKIIFLPSSHVPMISHPDEVADFILQAARSIVPATVNEAEIEE